MLTEVPSNPHTAVAVLPRQLAVEPYFGHSKPAGVATAVAPAPATAMAPSDYALVHAAEYSRGGVVVPAAAAGMSRQGKLDAAVFLIPLNYINSFFPTCRAPTAADRGPQSLPRGPTAAAAAASQRPRPSGRVPVLVQPSGHPEQLDGQVADELHPEQVNLGAGGGGEEADRKADRVPGSVASI